MPKSVGAWPRVVKSYKDVPSEFLRVFPEYEAAFPYTLVIPEEKGTFFQSLKTAKMLCVSENRLFLLENNRGIAVSREIPLDSIVSLEHGRILLKSWLKLSTGSNTITIPFNTVHENLFLPVIEAIRPAAKSEALSPLSQIRHQQELSKLGYLWKTNFKYFNLSRKSILPGESIDEVVYQPEIEFSALTLFRKPIIQRTLTGHLAILTENEFILIKEVEKTKAPQHVLYGGIFTYLPLKQISNVTFEVKKGKTDCVMTITLSDGSCYHAEFSSDNAVNLELFKEACASRLNPETV
jgi:hypothetical protein